MHEVVKKKYSNNLEMLFISEWLVKKEFLLFY